MKEELKEQFPLLFQCYKLARWELSRPMNRRAQKKFHAMTDEERRSRIAEQYSAKTGCKLDWEHLEGFAEKMQWAKLYDEDERKPLLTDKYAAREWVAQKIGQEYVVPLYGAWERYSDIEWDKLPNQFVLKTSHGCADVVIVKDKRRWPLAERLACYRVLNRAMERDYSAYAGEMHYHKIKHRIIAEQMLNNHGQELRDYKFSCFDGTPICCGVDYDRATNHTRNYYDMQWNRLDWVRYCPNNPKGEPKPKNFDKMVEIVKILSKGFPQVRVDLYNLDGKIYFGEMTFTSGAGLVHFQPESVEKMLGQMWHLDMTKK